MKSSILQIGKNKKETLALFVSTLILLISLFLYYRFQTYYALLPFLFSFLLLLYVLFYFNQKRKEEREEKEKEWSTFFHDLASSPDFTKSSLLEKEMPLPLRTLLEAAATREMKMEEYEELVAFLPSIYTDVLDSIFFFYANESKEEWKNAYHHFLLFEEKKREDKEKNVTKFQQILLFLLLFIFASIVMIFVIYRWKGGVS